MLGVPPLLFTVPLVADRSEALGELRCAWNVVRDASLLLQQLDRPVVHADDWANSYSALLKLLEEEVEAVRRWHYSPYPAENQALSFTQVYVYGWLQMTRRHVGRFEWNDAHAYLYGAGREILRQAALMGVVL